MVERARDLGPPPAPRGFGDFGKPVHGEPRESAVTPRIPRPADEQTDAERDLAALREKLLGPELRRLQAIERLLEQHPRLEGPTPEEIAAVLPAAIRLRQSGDNQLGRALGPTLESAIQDSVQRNPSAIAEAIFPALGPAIRRAIGAALTGLVESFNAALSASLSLRGLRWHLEARRTGRSFAEIALLHSIAWRTELVLLVHRETGTLLLSSQTSALTPVGATPDGDVVSAMLGAIQDFVSDSFARGAPTDLLRIAFDDRTLHVAVGPKVTLAALVRGVAPVEFTEQLQETCDLVHVLATARLAGFNGNTTPFTTLQPTLDDLLREEKAAHPSSRRMLLAWSLLLVVACGIGIGVLALRSAESTRLSAAVAALRDEQGIVVLSAGRQAGDMTLVLMRDPDAADVSVVLREAGLDPAALDIHEEPYVCLQPEFVRHRAVRSLDPPATVEIDLVRGRLEMRGTATHRWIQHALAVSNALPGVAEIDTSALVDIDEGRVTSGSFRLDRSVVAFVPGSTQFAVEIQEQTDLRQTVQLLANGARSVGWYVRVEVLGSQTAEEAAVDPGLALARARAIATLIDGWSDGVLTLSVVDGPFEARTPPAAEVRFKVTLHGAAR